MGNKPHHSGHYGGGVDLSKGKTPHDSLMKYMPVDDKGSNILNVGKPYSMGASMRGPLDKNVKVNSWEEEDVKRGRKEMAEGHKGHAEALFDDAHGSWNWGKSHHSTGPEMTGDKRHANKDQLDKRHALRRWYDGKDRAKEGKKHNSKGAEMRGPLNKNLISMNNSNNDGDKETKTKKGKMMKEVKSLKKASAAAAAKGAAEAASEMATQMQMNRIQNN